MRSSSRAQPKKEVNYWTLVVVIVIPILTWTGGTITTAWTYLDKVATKTQLEETFQKTIKYTDDKTAAVLQNAIEHDEKNRADTIFRTESMLNELKVRNAVVDTKIESLIKATGEIKNITESNQSRTRR